MSASRRASNAVMLVQNSGTGAGQNLVLHTKLNNLGSTVNSFDYDSSGLWAYYEIRYLCFKIDNGY